MTLCASGNVDKPERLLQLNHIPNLSIYNNKLRWLEIPVCRVGQLHIPDIPLHRRSYRMRTSHKRCWRTKTTTLEEMRLCPMYGQPLGTMELLVFIAHQTSSPVLRKHTRVTLLRLETVIRRTTTIKVNIKSRLPSIRSIGGRK